MLGISFFNLFCIEVCNFFSDYPLFLHTKTADFKDEDTATIGKLAGRARKCLEMACFLATQRAQPSVSALSSARDEDVTRSCLTYLAYLSYRCHTLVSKNVLQKDIFEGVTFEEPQSSIL